MATGPISFARSYAVDFSKIVRLPFNDLPSFVGLLIAVPVMVMIAKKVPLLNKI